MPHPVRGVKPVVQFVKPGHKHCAAGKSGDIANAKVAGHTCAYSHHLDDRSGSRPRGQPSGSAHYCARSQGGHHRLFCLPQLRSRIRRTESLSSCASIRFSNRPTARTGSRSIRISSTRSRSTTTTMPWKTSVSVPLLDRAAPAGPVPGLRRRSGGDRGSGQLAGPGAAGNADCSRPESRHSTDAGWANARPTRSRC